MFDDQNSNGSIFSVLIQSFLLGPFSTISRELSSSKTTNQLSFSRWTLIFISVAFDGIFFVIALHSFDYVKQLEDSFLFGKRLLVLDDTNKSQNPFENRISLWILSTSIMLYFYQHFLWICQYIYLTLDSSYRSYSVYLDLITFCLTVNFFCFLVYVAEFSSVSVLLYYVALIILRSFWSMYIDWI